MTPEPERRSAVTAAASSRVARGAAPTFRAVLPNGLTLLVRENHANPTLSVQGLVKAGAIFDRPSRAGLARFTASIHSCAYS